MIFKFNQAVGGTLGAVRVYDAQGNEVDDLDVTHPGGQQRWMGVGLKARLSDGTYTATYRVISADTHIVYGGLVFNIGHAGLAPRFTVAGLIARNKSGPVTEVAFGVVRGLSYLSSALMLGGLAFLAVAWVPGLAGLPGGEPRWSIASRMFARRLRGLLIAAIALGVAASVLGVLLQGASAAGVSLWASLKSTVIDNTLHTRFGQVWGLRTVDWVMLAGLLVAASASRREVVPELYQSSSSGDPATPTTRPPGWMLALGGIGLGYLALTPALAGHASVESPVALVFASVVLHVLAASVWVGGIACLVFVLPGATRQLEPAERSRLLLETLTRFSPLALLSVVALAATGVLQAYINVRSFNALLHTTYGALVLVKVAILLALIALGWINRERVIPGLRRLASEGHPPGRVGIGARRFLRSEIALMLSVLSVTAALISYTPPIDVASGPFAITTTIGPAELQMTVEPARVGPNTIHLYLIDAKTGSQFTATKELNVSAALPSKGIGPLPLKANLSGPGHYTLNSAVLSPSGTWQVRLTDRTSEFSEYTRTVSVPIR